MSSDLRPISNDATLQFADAPVIVNASRGVGTFLLFDLARSNARSTTKRPHESVWVYLCDWVIRRKGQVFCDSDFEQTEIVDQVLAKMVGESATELRVAPDATTATLDFSGGWEVELQEASDLYEPGSDLVRIFDRGKLAAVVRYPGGLMITNIVQTTSVADMARDLQLDQVAATKRKNLPRVLRIGRARRQTLKRA